MRKQKRVVGNRIAWRLPSEDLTAGTCQVKLGLKASHGEIPPNSTQPMGSSQVELGLKASHGGIPLSSIGVHPLIHSLKQLRPTMGYANHEL